MRKTDAGERNRNTAARRGGPGDMESAPVRECAPRDSPEQPEGLSIVSASDTNLYESCALVLGLMDRPSGLKLVLRGTEY